MNILKRARRLFQPDKKPRLGYQMDRRRVFAPQAAYQGLRDIQRDVSCSYWDAAANTLLLMQNNGWIAGMIEQSIANVVGPGLTLSAALENDLLGMKEEDARKWRKDVDRRFALWANNPLECDIEGRRTLGQMQQANFKNWQVIGESLQEISYRKRYGSPFGTKIRSVPPTAMSFTSDPDRNIVDGVKLNADGLPIGYLIKKKINGFEKEVLVRAHDSYGRAQTIHVFKGMSGQLRGISPFVPVLNVCKQLDRLTHSTIAAAQLKSVFTATLKTERPLDEVNEDFFSQEELSERKDAGYSPGDVWESAALDFYEKNEVNGARFVLLRPFESLELLTPNVASQNEIEWLKMLLRLISRVSGLNYTSATGDYAADGGYSSVRASISENIAVTLTRRKDIVAPSVLPIYDAWLEEAIELGIVPFPGGIEAFHYHRQAASRAILTGHSSPSPDELKTAKALETLIGLGVMSRTDAAAMLGVDYEDTLATLKQESEMRDEYGLELAPQKPTKATEADDDE